MKKLLLVTAAAVAGTVFPAVALASSVLWSTALPSYARFPSDSRCVPVMLSPQLSVQYAGDAYTADGIPVCGGSVPLGSTITVRPAALTPSDIFWFASGYYSDSPYGDPSVNAVAPGKMCDAKNIYAANFQITAASWVDFYGTMAVNPPARAVSGFEPYFACGAPAADGSVVCVAKQIGTAQGSMTFASTYAKPYAAYQSVGTCTEDTRIGGGWMSLNTYGSAVNPYDGTGWHNCSGKGDSTISIPAQTVACSVSVSASSSGSAPGRPAVAAVGTASCRLGFPYEVTVSSVDPAGSRVRYGIDWNNDGYIDQFVPSAGYVPSGTVQTASRTFAVPGAKRIRIVAINEQGISSASAPFTFTCSGTIATDTFFDDNGNSIGGGGTHGSNGAPSPDLTLRATPSLVHRGDPVKVSWSATGVASCVVSAPNGDMWNALESIAGGNPTAPITSQTTYTLHCIDRSGDALEKKATVDILPNWQEQ